MQRYLKQEIIIFFLQKSYITQISPFQMLTSVPSVKGTKALEIVS